MVTLLGKYCDFIIDKSMYNEKDMEILEAVVLGAVQGLTEFIPVSSSGHLVIGQYFFSGGSDHLFLEFINIGTVLALLIFFRKRIYEAVYDVLVNRNFKLAINILLSALPAGLLGLFLGDMIAAVAFFGNIYVVLVALVVVGAIMIVLEKLPKATPVKDGESLPWYRALTIGIAQMFALIPGVSRSGSTIIAGRLMGLKPAAAAEYSFLLSIPIMLGVTAKLLVRESDRLYMIQNWETLLIGNIVALICGLVAVKFLMEYLAKNDLKVFGWYRIALAVVVFGVLLIQ